MPLANGGLWHQGPATVATGKTEETRNVPGWDTSFVRNKLAFNTFEFASEAETVISFQGLNLVLGAGWLGQISSS